MIVVEAGNGAADSEEYGMLWKESVELFQFRPLVLKKNVRSPSHGPRVRIVFFLVFGEHTNYFDPPKYIYHKT